MKCAHLQCVNNHCVKFEYKGMNTVGVTARLGGKFHPRYLPVAFTGISQHGKKGSSGKYNF